MIAADSPLRDPTFRRLFAAQLFSLTAVLLILLPFTVLFDLNALGFIASAALIVSATLPAAARGDRVAGVWNHIRFSIRAYLATPRLRALLALHLAVSAGGTMVIVNTRRMNTNTCTATTGITITHTRAGRGWSRISTPTIIIPSPTAIAS